MRRRVRALPKEVLTLRSASCVRTGASTICMSTDAAPSAPTSIMLEPNEVVTKIGTYGS